jgi:hypothetical protein
MTWCLLELEVQDNEANRVDQNPDDLPRRLANVQHCLRCVQAPLQLARNAMSARKPLIALHATCTNTFITCKYHRQSTALLAATCWWAATARATCEQTVPAASN